MVLEVRPARHPDVPSIVAWTTNTFEWGDYVPVRLPQWIDDPDSMPLVCVDESGEVIGVLNTSMLSSHEAWLEGARVRPDRKRAGAGSAMNAAGLDWARSSGGRVARLATEAGNVAARTQVESMGYRHTSSWAHVSLDPSVRLPVTSDSAMKTAPAADIDAAWLSWVSGDLARAGRELLAEGWRWRQAHPDDLVSAARRGELLQSPGGWAIVQHLEEDWMRTGWVSTTPEEALEFFNSLLELAASRNVDQVDVKMAWLPWASEALTRAGGEPHEIMVYTIRL